MVLARRAGEPAERLMAVDAGARCARCWGSPQTTSRRWRLARDGGHAFVSSALRPYLSPPSRHRRRGRARGRRWWWWATTARPATWRRPARLARSPAGALYPSRGVAYESHLAPPPHLVGLRVAALDALLGAALAGAERGTERDGSRSSCQRRGAVGEGPRPGAAARAPSRCGWASCSTSTSAPRSSSSAGYERVEQVEERGQFALRGGILDIFPATEERAVRVDMFDVEIESLRWFSTFTQRSLGEVEEVELAPAAELALEHRELAEIAAADGRLRPAARRRESDRADIAELLPRRALRRAARPARRARPSSCSPPRRSSSRRSATTGATSARRSATRTPQHLYVQPRADPRGARRAHPHLAVGAVHRAADRAARPGRRLGRPLAGGGRARARAPGALRLPHRRRVPPPRRGRARRLQPRAA